METTIAFIHGALTCRIQKSCYFYANVIMQNKTARTITSTTDVRQ